VERCAAPLAQAASTPSPASSAYKSHTPTFFPIFSVSAGTPPPPLFPIADGEAGGLSSLLFLPKFLAAAVTDFPLVLPVQAAVAPADPFRFPPLSSATAPWSPSRWQQEPLPVPFRSLVTSSSSHRSRPAEAAPESRATVERIPRQPPRASASPRWTFPPRATLRRSELSLPLSPGSTTETERSQVPEAAAGALSLPSSTSWSSVR
jgi:hypothetical protein